MPETEYNFTFVTTPGAASATGFVVGPSRRVRVTVSGIRCKPIKVISEEFPLTDNEQIAVAEKVHLLMLVVGCTPDMIDSVDWDFRVCQPEPAPPPPSSLFDDEMFEDYSDGWKHLD